MANLKQRTNTQRTSHDVSLLDTLVQLRIDPLNSNDNQIVTNLESKAKKDLKNYQKRAKAKAVTNAITKRLVDVKGSKMIKYYWNAYHCNNVILQNNMTLTATYCNTRHCVNCNRIRTAKAINGYTKPLNKLEYQNFVTLTRQSVKSNELNEAICKMTLNFRNVLKNMKNTYGIKLKGIRKLECNHNENTDTYNPHFHLIVNGTPCQMLLFKSLWLNKYTTLQADPQAQHFEKAKENTEKEIFKYMVKMIAKDGINPESLDTIFTAIKGKRTIQPFGGIKKVTEDVEDIQKQEVNFVQSENQSWVWSDMVLDWVTEWGEVLTNYKPSSYTVLLLNNINNPPNKSP